MRLTKSQIKKIYRDAYLTATEQTANMVAAAFQEALRDPWPFNGPAKKRRLRPGLTVNQRFEVYWNVNFKRLPRST